MKTHVTIMCLFIILSGCTNEDLLVDQFDEVKTKANPFFAGSCHDMEGWMLSENSALVYNGDYGIHTDDGFKTFSYIKFKESGPCENGYLKTLYFDGESYRVFDDYKLYYKDPLSDLQTFDIRNLKHSPAVGTFDSFSIPIFESDHSFYFVRKFHDQNNVLVNLYQGDMSDLSVTFQSTIYSVNTTEDIYGHLGMFATDDQLIYADQEFITSSDSIYINIHATSDGRNWRSSRVMGLPSKAFYNLPMHGYQNELKGRKLTLIFGNSSFGFYNSRDGGNTWRKINFGFSDAVTSLTVIDEQTIYGLTKKDLEYGAGTISQLVVSNDAGMTWEIKPAQFYGDRISFFDKKNGMAMSKQILQLTNDGGETWKPIFMGKVQ